MNWVAYDSTQTREAPVGGQRMIDEWIDQHKKRWEREITPY
jgi:hypothetical protein